MGWREYWKRGFWTRVLIVFLVLLLVISTPLMAIWYRISSPSMAELLVRGLAETFALSVFVAVYHKLVKLEETFEEGRIAGAVSFSIVASLAVSILSLYGYIPGEQVIRSTPLYLLLLYIVGFVLSGIGIVVGPYISLCRQVDHWLYREVFGKV